MKEILSLITMLLITQSVLAEGNYGAGFGLIVYGTMIFIAVAILAGIIISFSTKKMSHWLWIILIIIAIPIAEYVLIFGI